MVPPLVSMVAHGTVVGGRFRLLRPLGVGSCGVVYAAQDSAGRPAAVKIVHKGLALGRQDMDSAFFCAAAAAAALVHPNTLRTTDYGRTDDGRFFLAHDLIPPGTLQDLLWAQGSLSPAETVSILRSVGESLVEAHGNFTFHGQLAANNILVPFGRIDQLKVTDYGQRQWLCDESTDSAIEQLPLCRAREMAPEQIRGEGSSTAGDIFCLGQLAVQLLTGRPAYDGECPMQVLLSMLSGPPVLSSSAPPFIPPALCALITRCLQPDPRDRFDSVSTLLGALDDALGPECTILGPRRIDGAGTGEREIPFGLWDSEAVDVVA